MNAPLTGFQESKTVFISTIRNDGVLRSTPNDPGDTMPVVRFLAADPDGLVTSFIPRRMTIHLLGRSHYRYGRVKQDIGACLCLLTGQIHRAAERYKRSSGAKAASQVITGVIS